MKKLILFLPLLISASIFAQKPLPVDCPGLKEKLLLIQKSFPEFESWKKDKILGGEDITQWKTDFSLCGLNGILEIFFGHTFILGFTFDKIFSITDPLLKDFTNKIHEDIKEIFGTTFTEKYEEQEGDDEFDAYKKYTWKLNNTGSAVPEKSIVLQFSAEESKLKISFTYYKKK